MTNGADPAKVGWATRMAEQQGISWITASNFYQFNSQVWICIVCTASMQYPLLIIVSKGPTWKGKDSNTNYL